MIVPASAKRVGAAWRCLLLALSGWLLTPLDAPAQPSREVFALTGFGRVAEDEGFLGDGHIVGAGVGFELGGRWEMTGDVRRQEHGRSGSEGSFIHEGHTVAAGAGLLYRLSRRRVQPFFRLGASYARMTATRGFSATPFSPGDTFSGTQGFFGPDLGFGTKIGAHQHLSLRAEIRTSIGNSGPYTPGADLVEPPLFITTFTAGVGYRW